MARGGKRDDSDILCYSLPFGGGAFEPKTEKGKVWAAGIIADAFDGLFLPDRDACMADFGEGCFGVEPCDRADYVIAARASGLLVGSVSD